MANWITHAALADLLLQRLPSLHRRGFCVGSIAPDCNIENPDWTAFTPPREVTHFMRGESKLSADYIGFWREYAVGRAGASDEEYSFLCGYAAHLIADAAFQRFTRDSARTADMFARVKAAPTYAAQIAGMPETFDTCKAVFGRKRMFADIAACEGQYLADHPDSCYLTVLRGVTDFPDYLDFLPPGAIARKIAVMAVLPSSAEEVNIFFTADEYARFLSAAVDEIFAFLQRHLQDRSISEFQMRCSS